MKLYEIDERLTELLSRLEPDEETGEVMCDDELLSELEALGMEKKRILTYLAQEVLNTRSDAAALKAEEDRLAKRRKSIENREERLMAILERECCGEKKTDLGVAIAMVIATEKDSKTKKARGGSRVMYTSHNPCWDAKNRSGLPEVLPLDFGKIAHLFADTDTPAANVSETPNSSVPDSDGQPRTVADSDGQTTEKALTKKQQALLQMTERTTYPPGFSFATVQQITFERGKIPSADTPIEEFSDELITKWIIPNWANIIALAERRFKEVK